MYADSRGPGKVAKWEQELGNAPMRLVPERIINEQVARGSERFIR